MVLGSYIVGIVFALLSALMYSLASILYRAALEDVDEILVTAIRSIPAFFSILLLTIFIGEGEYLCGVDEMTLFYGFIGGALGMMLGAYFYMKALKFGGVSIGFPTSFTYPVFVSLIATIFLNEKLTVGIVAGLISTLTGITIIASREKNQAQKNPLKGALNGLVAANLWAVTIAVAKIALENYPPIPFATIRLLFATLVALPIIMVNREKLKTTKNHLATISAGGFSE